MSLCSIFALLLFIPSVLSLGFVNSQIPSIPTASKTGTFVGVGKVDPRLKFAPSFVQELNPWGDRVLLSISQADTSQGFQGMPETRAVIVRVGTAITDPLLVEGATVLLNPTCTAKNTNGEYTNGVSLNNANPLTLQTSLTALPTAGTYAGYPGANSINFYSTTNWDETSAFQQDNYVVCSGGSIVGVITNLAWNANHANTGSYYIQKPLVWSQKTSGYQLY